MSDRAPIAEVSTAPQDGETLDAICGGRVKILQRLQGYRFNLDPILLAHFAHASSRGLKGRGIDLGTGTGIIPLLLAQKFDKRDLFGVEIQPALHSLAVRNTHLNACADRVHLLRADLRDAPALLGRSRFSHVLTNPPYGAVHGGKLNPTAERAIARHELLCSLDDVVRASAELLVDCGSLWMVYPSTRLTDLFAALGGNALRPRRLQAVHPRPSGKARLVLVQAVKRGRSALTLCPPLFLHEEGKEGFSGAVSEMLAAPVSH